MQSNDPDLWHVLLAPGETKVISLEQLDDLFRLEIIDAETRVWQPGMTEWLPLSVVAGMDEAPEQTLPRSVPPPHRGAPPLPARRPPPPSSVRPAPVVAVTAAPPPRAPAPQQRPAPAPVAAVASPPAAAFNATRPWPPAPAAAPAPIPANAAGSAWPNVTQPIANPWPAAAAPAQSAWPAVTPNTQSAWSTPAESVRPFVMSGRPPEAPSGGGWGGRFVLGLALVAGLSVTLYRNDVLRDAALSMGRANTYQQLEQSLGGPGFGTVRAVQSLGEGFAATSLPVPTTSLGGTSSTSAAAREPASVAATPPAPSQPSEASTTKPSPAPAELSSLVAAQLAGGEKSRPSNAKSAPASAPAPRAKAASGGKGPDLAVKGSSNKYDPLNGKL